MSKFYVFFLFSLIVGPLTTNAQWGGAICIDCRQENDNKCVIEGAAGWSCGTELTKDRPRKERSAPMSPTTLDMNVCVPEGLDIQDNRAGELVICCFWSAKLGCQVVVPKSGYIPMECNECQNDRVNNYVNLTACPCVDKRSEGGLGRYNYGSKPSPCSSLPVLLGICLTIFLKTF
ncbi:uncharacterized protein Dana_GF24604 [Drosophila ananassae]|uniref:DUF753 domain-containing protein n=1 Tax=Drosophila ananassae TaxID=7217 RepID=A0A0P8XTA1_DROAN|nr:uncharacterized protein LOC6507235 [Drosophila ananassae]KPU77953.1 uncharacterized protein Dana_GF24604 [Drosophila ananassae]